MKVLITGANGFVGQNLALHLSGRAEIEVTAFTRSHTPAQLTSAVAEADFIFHLAGVNRPKDPAEFAQGNTDLTRMLCEAVVASGRPIPVLYTSSTQAALDNPYGISKREAEQVLLDLHRDHGSPVHLFRLPNVFGKWARPQYNSAVASFCHNIAQGLPIEIHDAQAPMRLVYIDDVIAQFIAVLDGVTAGTPFVAVAPEYATTVGELAEQLYRFKASRDSLTTEAVGTGLVRALYSTYLSYLTPAQFSYGVTRHADPRGVFVEMLKTKDSGQFSFFTAHPGITRGGHYHHTKTEKFLVIKGKACFRFRHMLTGQFHELHTSAEPSQVVETVPGWTHDITNVGDDELIVMLWANEIFDRAHPDTYAMPVGTQA